MRVIGITGGVGSGKSQVLTYIQETYGANICQLDEVAKKLQKKGERCFEQILCSFGEEVRGTDGELDRERLGQIVFQNKEKLQILNQIVHPEVKRWVQQDISKKEKEGILLYVIEAALMPDAGYDDICQEMWYIYTEESVRRARLKASRNYSDEKITQMILSQPSEKRFREVSDVVIDNSGDFEETKKKIGEILS